MLECPQFDDVRAQYADLLQDGRGSMRNLMWHQNQKALSDFVIAILDEPRTCTRTRPHRPCWPNGRSESLSLSLAEALTKKCTVHMTRMLCVAVTLWHPWNRELQ